jgi:hypothetical protein
MVSPELLECPPNCLVVGKAGLGREEIRFTFELFGKAGTRMISKGFDLFRGDACSGGGLDYRDTLGKGNLMSMVSPEFPAVPGIPRSPRNSPGHCGLF